MPIVSRHRRALGSAAERTGRSKSFYARQAILEHRDDLEDVYLAGESAWKSFGKARRYGFVERPDDAPWRGAIESSPGLRNVNWTNWDMQVLAASFGFSTIAWQRWTIRGPSVTL